jgi:cell division protein FtsL
LKQVVGKLYSVETLTESEHRHKKEWRELKIEQAVWIQSGEVPTILTAYMGIQ